jgi:hypothetical protein
LTKKLSPFKWRNLEAFGKLFSAEGVLYPMLDEMGISLPPKSKVHPRMKNCTNSFKFNGKVVDIDDFDPETLEVFSVKY